MDPNENIVIPDESAVPSASPSPMPSAAPVAATPSKDPNEDIVIGPADEGLAPDGSAMLPAVEPVIEQEGRVEDAIVATLYGALNGATQVNLGDELVANIAAIVSKRTREEELADLQDYDKRVRQEYPWGMPAAEVAGSILTGGALKKSFGLIGSIPGIDKAIASMSVAGKAKFVNTLKSAGLMAGVGTVAGYYGTPVVGDDERPGAAQNMALYAGAGPVLQGAGKLSMKALQVFPLLGEKFTGWMLKNRAPTEEQKQILGEALGRYKSSFTMGSSGATSDIDKIDFATANELAGEVANAFTLVADDLKNKSGKVAESKLALNSISEAGAKLVDKTRNKLKNFEFPEAMAVKMQDGLNEVQNKITEASERGFAAIKGKTIGLDKILSAIASGNKRLRGYKGYSILDEQSAENALTQLSARIHGMYGTKNAAGKIVLPNPESVQVPAEVVKDLLQSFDRNLDGMYEKAAGQYQSELAGNMAFKKAFKDVRQELSASLKFGNTDYEKAMLEAKDLQDARRNMLDLIKWKSDSTRGIRDAIETIANRTTAQEQEAIDGFARVATGGKDISSSIARYTAAQKTLKDIDNVMDWGRAMTDTQNALNDLMQIQSILPAEYAESKNIINAIIDNDSAMRDAEDALYQYGMKNKKLLSPSAKTALRDYKLSGKTITNPEPLIRTGYSAQSLVKRLAKPEVFSRGAVQDDLDIISSIEGTGYTGSDLLSRISDVRAAQAMGRGYIQGSRGVTTGKAFGQGVAAAASGGDPMITAIGGGIGAGTAFVAEQFGATAGRKIFRYFIKKQMAWSKGISKVPGAMALAGSNALRSYIDIKKESPEYNDIVTAVVKDVQLSVDKKLEVLKKCKDGIKIDMENPFSGDEQ